MEGLSVADWAQITVAVGVIVGVIVAAVRVSAKVDALADKLELYTEESKSSDIRQWKAISDLDGRVHDVDKRVTILEQ